MLPHTRLQSTLHIIGLTLALLALLPAHATVHEKTLSNGLKVLVKPDFRAPVVNSQLWYKVGASDEHNGITGLAHMLEHMMFRGTKQYADGVFSKKIARIGGDQNAFTGRDYTAYFQTVHSDHLSLILSLEADRMCNLHLQQTAFDKERQVVIEERKLRVDDKPINILNEQFYSLAHTTSPYQNPIIGWIDDIEHYTLKDLQQFYDKYYAPNNATLVLIGAVQPDQAFALAEKHFEQCKARSIEQSKPRSEIEQRSIRRLEMFTNNKTNYLMLGFRLPSPVTLKNKTNHSENVKDGFILQFIAEILSGSDSARLSKDIVRDKRLASSSGAYYNITARYDTLLVLDAMLIEPEAGTPPFEEVEKRLLEHIISIQKNGVKLDELQRVKNRVEAEYVYKQDSIFYQGYELGVFETIGLNWSVVEQYIQTIRAITSQDIQRVATQYINTNLYTVARLKHQKN